MTAAVPTPPMIVLAPDKFRGSLSAVEVARHLRVGFRRALPGVGTTLMPIADGGEGTLDAVLTQGFTTVPVPVTGPLGELRSARIAVRGTTAVLELAEASGLALVEPARRDPRAATSRGLGELILAALEHGSRTLIIGLGGSASTDGGAGMLQALGARLLDEHGSELAVGGGALAELRSVDLSGLDPRLSETRLRIASDVDNPLLGPSGAAAVYAPQKGAGAEDVAFLELALGRWAAAVAAAVGRDHSGDRGAGAAGGVGFGLIAVLGAELESGIEVMLELTGFHSMLATAALVVTGEGRLDSQSLHGKAPVGVAAAANAAGVPVVAVVGTSSLTPAEAQGAGFSAVYALTDREPDVARCLAEAGRLVEDIAIDIADDMGPDMGPDSGADSGADTAAGVTEFGQ